jgi:hypothetical protein
MPESLRSRRATSVSYWTAAAIVLFGTIALSLSIETILRDPDRATALIGAGMWRGIAGGLGGKAMIQGGAPVVEIPLLPLFLLTASGSCFAWLAYPDLSVGVQTGTAGGGNGGEPRAMQQAGVRVAAIRVDAAIISHHLLPSRLALLEDGRIGQRRAVELVLVQIRDDLVTVLNEGDGAAKGGFRTDMADD